MATIIGITGAIGSGKSTFSDMLGKIEPHSATYECGQIITEVAEQFNHALASELSFEVADGDVEIINQALIWLSQLISEQLHKEVAWTRLALTKHRLAVHPEYYEKLFVHLKQLKANPALATQSITKNNKAAYRPLLQWLGGYLVATVSKTIWLDEIFHRIDLYDDDKKLIIINSLRYPADAEAVRAHGGFIVAIQRPGLNPVDSTDSTETSRAQITPDIRLNNNGTLEQLHNTVTMLWNDIGSGKPQEQYTAHT